MVHRSDLVAAHARIEALERELAAMRRQKDKPLRCARCQSPFESGDLDPEQSAILCRRCRARVSLARWPSPDRPRPSRTDIVVKDDGVQVRVTSVATAGAGVYWAVGLTVLFGTVAIVALVASMIVAAVAAAVLAMVALVVAFGSSSAQLIAAASESALAIERSGPPARATRIGRVNVDQIYVAPGTDAYGAMFRIFALLTDGTRHLLVNRIDDWPEARRIEGLLESRLGVADRAIEGEVRRD